MARRLGCSRQNVNFLVKNGRVQAKFIDKAGRLHATKALQALKANVHPAYARLEAPPDVDAERENGELATCKGMERAAMDVAKTMQRTASCRARRRSRRRQRPHRRRSSCRSCSSSTSCPAATGAGPMMARANDGQIDPEGATALPGEVARPALRAVGGAGRPQRPRRRRRGGRGASEGVGVGRKAVRTTLGDGPTITVPAGTAFGVVPLDMFWR